MPLCASNNALPFRNQTIIKRFNSLYKKKYIFYEFNWNLRVVFLFDVNRRHRLEPRATQLETIRVRLGETILRVDEHLAVVLEALHLSRGHEYVAYAFR